jgi:hypothetical protein
MSGFSPAFPHPGVFSQFGLSKREYFAAMAMQGLLAARPHNLAISSNALDDLSGNAVYFADALIAALAEPQP